MNPTFARMQHTPRARIRLPLGRLWSADRGGPTHTSRRYDHCDHPGPDRPDIRRVRYRHRNQRRNRASPAIPKADQRHGRRHTSRLDRSRGIGDHVRHTLRTPCSAGVPSGRTPVPIAPSRPAAQIMRRSASGSWLLAVTMSALLAGGSVERVVDRAECLTGASCAMCAFGRAIGTASASGAVGRVSRNEQIVGSIPTGGSFLAAQELLSLIFSRRDQLRGPGHGPSRVPGTAGCKG
jgi:hypothetical protein